MTEIYLKANSDGKVYAAEKGNLKMETGDAVLFESDQCQETAVILADKNSGEGNEKVGVETVKAEIIRRLNDKDNEIIAQRKEEALKMLPRCKEIVEKHSLPMEMADADLSYDGKKVTFYFSAPGRVDFRLLVSELASVFQKSIRLQQIGARESTRSCGGIGKCGQDLCCKRFLKGNLDDVTMDMAYTQNLAQMGTTRCMGACGKLMCCLKYEMGLYEEGKESLPKVGSKIKTEKGEGVVIGQNIIKQSVNVELADRNRLEVKC